MVASAGCLVAASTLGCNAILGFEDGQPIGEGQGGGADGGAGGGVPCADLEDGDPCDGGRCRAGECCTGCWSGTECLDGIETNACGARGVDCEACGCASDSCSAGRCAPSDPIRSLGLGSHHSCVATHGGALWCWGHNDENQLGLSDALNRTSPERIDDRSDWAIVRGGQGHSCALTTEGARWCWGRNGDGQLGLGDTIPRAEPTLATDNRTNMVVLGLDHGCRANSSRMLWCWGMDDRGQLGLAGTGESVLVPTPVGDAQWESLSTRRWHGCGIQFDTTLWCWGYNIDGELGLGDQNDDHTQPEQVGPDADWHQVAAAGFSTCAIHDPGELWCWGGNAAGQLGIGVLGPGTASTVPIRVGGGTNWTQVAASPRSHLCGLRGDGELWCWGNNDSGQLGVGTIDDEPSPTRVGTAQDWTELSLGHAHTCGVRDGGSLWCWGDNTEGQLGTDQGSQALEPVRICF